MVRKVFTIAGEPFVVNERFTPIRLLGRGSFGMVVAAEVKDTKELVAIKKVIDPFTQRKDALRTLREVKLVKHCQHENILCMNETILPDSVEDYKDCYIVTDLMDTDLHQIIRSKQPLSDDHFKYFLYQILKGLKYLHSANVIHRDMKPGNLLVNRDCFVKICDFGLAREHDPDMTTYVITRWYRPPEVLMLARDYTTAVDVWSVGCIFAEMLLRKPVFPGSDYLQQLDKITDILGTPSAEDVALVKNDRARRHMMSLKHKPARPWKSVIPKASKEALDLLSRMLVFDPAKRITVSEALKHPYLESLYDESQCTAANEPIDWSFEQLDLTTNEIRDMVYNELLEVTH